MKYLSHDFSTLSQYLRLTSYAIGYLNWPKGHDSRGLGRTSGSSGISDSIHPQREQAGLQNSSDRSHNTFGLPTAASSLGSLQPPVCFKLVV